MFCQNCGSPIDLNDFFCPRCGIQTQKNQSENVPEKKNYAAKKRIPFWFKSLIGIIVLLVILASFIIRFSDDLTEVAQGQLDSLRAHQMTEAYYKFTSKDFQEATSLEAFRTFIKSYPIFLNYISASFDPGKVENSIGILNGMLTGEDGHTTDVEFKLSKDEGHWKIASIVLVQPQQKPQENPKSLSPQEIDALVAPLKEQLGYLKQNEIEKAYNDSSKEFKQITSLEAFHTFINDFPILTNYNSVGFKESSIESGFGKVLAELHSDNETTDVQYILNMENGQWKIWGIQVVNQPESSQEPSALTPPSGAKTPLDSSKKTPNFKAEDLVKVVQNQLSALKNKKIEDAYSQFTSQLFQQENSFEKFQDFIDRHPQFTNYQSLNFSKVSYQEGVAKVVGALISSNNASFPIEFTMVREGDDWKIQEIQVHTETGQEKTAPIEKSFGTKPAASALEFTNALIGTQVDSHGLVTDPTTTITTRNSDIIVNLFVHNGVAGTRVEMFFKHLDSNSIIPPISTTLQQNGDTRISFVFSPPSNGWPKGIYELNASAATGETKAFNFKIE